MHDDALKESFDRASSAQTRYFHARQSELATRAAELIALLLDKELPENWIDVPSVHQEFVEATSAFRSTGFALANALADAWPKDRILSSGPDEYYVKTEDGALRRRLALGPEVNFLEMIEMNQYSRLLQAVPDFMPHLQAVPAAV